MKRNSEKWCNKKMKNKSKDSDSNFLVVISSIKA